MRCEEVMSTPVRTVSNKDDALGAACLMREHRVGFLPVCDAAGRVVGIVTERDLAIRVCAENAEAKDVFVSDIMTVDPVACKAAQSVAEVQRQMIAHQHSVLVVVDDRDRPIGVISLRDIYEATDHRIPSRGPKPRVAVKSP